MDESTYAVIASKLGLSTNFIIKDHYLMRLLQYISMYTNKELILTGGTAINKVYLKEKARFSEDADFELTFKIGINELIALVDRVIAKADDFFGVEKRLLKVYYQTDLKYKQPGIEDKVRLDIAFNEIAPKRSEFSQIEITSTFSSERAYGLNVYSLESFWPGNFMPFIGVPRERTFMTYSIVLASLIRRSFTKQAPASLSTKNWIL